MQELIKWSYFCNIQMIIEHFTSNVFMDFSSIIKTLKLHLDYPSQSNGLEACWPLKHVPKFSMLLLCHASLSCQHWEWWKLCCKSSNWCLCICLSKWNMCGFGKVQTCINLNVWISLLEKWTCVVHFRNLQIEPTFATTKVHNI